MNDGSPSLQRLPAEINSAPRRSGDVYAKCENRLSVEVCTRANVLTWFSWSCTDRITRKAAKISKLSSITQLHCQSRTQEGKNSTVGRNPVVFIHEEQFWR